ncbi:MAG: MFS transporter [Pseudomonadota bacterium]
MLAALIGVACGASPLPFNTIGFVIEPIEMELGWARWQISASVMFFGITGAILAPVFGWMADQYGVRKVALLSIFGFGITFAAVGATPASVYGFWALWFLVGLVGIGSTPVTFSRAVNLWFFKNRGLALGIMLVGTSLAALTVPRLALWAISEFGWRGMYPVVALLPICVALPLAFFLFREPTKEEMPRAIREGGNSSGLTLTQAIRTTRFWIIFASIVCVSLSYGGAHIHMPEIIKQHGMTVEQGASIMGMIGLALLAGRIITGMLLDRFWAPLVCLPILTIPAFACFLLMGSSTDFSVIYIAAFMLGFAAGAESDLIAYLASRYFGMKKYGTIYGLLYLPFGLCSAISPVLYGYVYDTNGSYDAALYGAMFGFVAGAILLLFLGKYPDSFEETTEQAPPLESPPEAV